MYVVVVLMKSLVFEAGWRSGKVSSIFLRMQNFHELKEDKNIKFTISPFFYLLLFQMVNKISQVCSSGILVLMVDHSCNGRRAKMHLFTQISWSNIWLWNCQVFQTVACNAIVCESVYIIIYLT